MAKDFEYHQQMVRETEDLKNAGYDLREPDVRAQLMDLCRYHTPKVTRPRKKKMEDKE